jgi:hypothetical protein
MKHAPPLALRMWDVKWDVNRTRRWETQSAR